MLSCLCTISTCQQAKGLSAPSTAIHDSPSLRRLLWAMWPQARPLLSSYIVLRWRMNLWASTILGLVGGGGLGQAIYNNVQLGSTLG